jgi:hypothetical protein
VRMRSSNSCGGTEIWVDIASLPWNFVAGLTDRNRSLVCASLCENAR